MAMNGGADGDEDKAGDKRQHSSNVSTMSEDSTATANSFGTKGTSKASTFTSKASSRGSLLSRATLSASALLRKSLKVVGQGEAPPEPGVGDHCEAVTSVTMRAAESLESDVVTVLPAGTAMRVTEVGLHRRIKVEAQVPPHGLVAGWVSTKTKMSEPLVIRCTPEMPLVWADFEVGGTHEVKSVVTVRKGESLDSELVAELAPGAVVQICEVGLTNRRRVRVSAADRAVEGWISTVTRQGAPLLGKVTQSAPAGGRERQSRASMRTSLSTGAKSHNEAIFDAVKSGDLRQVRKVTERRSSVFMKLAPGMRGGADVNACDVRGKTPLIYAAAGGHKDVVEYLLLQGADVTAVDDTEKTALHHAARRPRADSDLQPREVTRARSSPSSSSSCGPATTWCSATMADAHAEIVQILLHSGARVDARDHNGCTALMFAAANGRAAVARELLHTQADVNVRDKEGHRALDYATRFGHSDVVALLRRRGAEVGGWRVSEAADQKAATPEEPQEEEQGSEEEVASRKPLSGEEASQAEELQQLLELPPELALPQAPPSESSEGVPEPETPKQPPDEEDEEEQQSVEPAPSASGESEVPEPAPPLQLPPSPVAASKKTGISLPPPPIAQQGKVSPHSLRAATAVSFPAPKPAAEGRLASTSDTAGDGLRASSVSTSASGGSKKKASSKPAATPKRRPNPRLARSIPTMEAVREANEDDTCQNARRSDTRETRSTSASTTPTSRDPPSSPDHHFRLKLRDGGDLELRIATRGKSEHLEGYVRDSMSMTSSLSSSPSPRRSAYTAVAAAFPSLREDTLPELPTSAGGGGHPPPFLPVSPCSTCTSGSGTARGRALSAAAATGSKASLRPVSSPKAGGGLSLRKSSTRSNSTQPPQQSSLRPQNRRLGTKEPLSALATPEGDDPQRRRWKKQADRLQGTPSASPSPSEAADPKDSQVDPIETAI